MIECSSGIGQPACINILWSTQRQAPAPCCIHKDAVMFTFFFLPPCTRLLFQWKRKLSLAKRTMQTAGELSWDVGASSLLSSEQTLILFLGCICMTLISLCLYSMRRPMVFKAEEYWRVEDFPPCRLEIGMLRCREEQNQNLNRQHHRSFF